MKKTLSLILSALMVAGMSTAAMAWEKGVDYLVLEEVDPDNLGELYGDAYPGSLDWDWAEVTSGQLLKGTVITGCNAEGSHCWENGTNNAAKLFDGDTSSFFDPYEATPNSWAGIMLDQAYELTEVRISPRETFIDRMKGAAVQGSNDGEKWVTIIYVDGKKVSEAPAGYDYHCFTPTTNEEYTAYYTDYGIEEPDFSTYWVGSGSYQYYRYVNLEGVHGDSAEIEFYGNPAPATEVTDDMVTAIKIDDINNFYGDVEVTEAAATAEVNGLVGTVIGGGGAYSDTASYEMAWDGDVTTFYDPASAGVKCFTGIQVAEPTALAEVHLLPRIGQNARSKNMHVQGSNDGIVWDDIVIFEEADCLPQADDIDDAEEQAWIVKPSTNTAAYTMFRYVSDGTSHGDVAELKFIPGEATVAETEAPETEAPVETEAPETEAPVEETEAPVETEAEVVETEPEVVETEAPAVEEEVEAPQTFDFGVIAAVAAIVSAAGYAISKKRN